MTDDPYLATLELPRTNGELVFEEPWQARALGMGVVALRELGVGPVAWRDALAEAITRHGHDPDEDPATAYSAAWVDALEQIVSERA
ncbi:MAG: nitrile hydratase accessory protein [Actinobacteria bacterium]|nr:nitrile hydratase accessory protein [Actinomycetota bacterium]